jgi:two-component system cell cycle response regulator DivK
VRISLASKISPGGTCLRFTELSLLLRTPKGRRWQFKTTPGNDLPAMVLEVVCLRCWAARFFLGVYMTNSRFGRGENPIAMFQQSLALNPPRTSAKVVKAVLLMDKTRSWCYDHGATYRPMLAEAVTPKILFIDDDPLMHALYKPHLERAGYEVISLLVGEQVLEVASRELPRIVIMDMLLPGVDGLAAILLLKSAAATKRIPIIAISANQSFLGVGRQLQSVGAEAFLSKPFGAAKLVSEIRRLDNAANQLPPSRAS